MMNRILLAGLACLTTFVVQQGEQPQDKGNPLQMVAPVPDPLPGASNDLAAALEAREAAMAAVGQVGQVLDIIAQRQEASAEVTGALVKALERVVGHIEGTQTTVGNITRLVTAQATSNSELEGRVAALEKELKDLKQACENNKCTCNAVSVGAAPKAAMAPPAPQPTTGYYAPVTGSSGYGSQGSAARAGYGSQGSNVASSGYGSQGSNMAAAPVTVTYAYSQPAPQPAPPLPMAPMDLPGPYQPVPVEQSVLSTSTCVFNPLTGGYDCGGTSTQYTGPVQSAANNNVGGPIRKFLSRLRN